MCETVGGESATALDVKNMAGRQPTKPCLWSVERWHNQGVWSAEQRFEEEKGLDKEIASGGRDNGTGTD